MPRKTPSPPPVASTRTSAPAGTDALRRLGQRALASRLKRLSDALYAEARQVYADRALDFEPRWFPVFHPLQDGERLPVSALAAHSGFTHPAVVQLVNDLVARGLVRTGSDPGDRRRRMVSLSARGRALLPGLREAWADIAAATGEVLGDAGADLLGALERFEHSLATRGVHARARERERQRKLDAVELLPWDPTLASRFAALNRAWIEELFALEPEDRRVLGDPRGAIIDRGGVILFARLRGRVVGTCALIPRGQGSWELTKMAVEARHRGHQVGRRLALGAIGEVRRRRGKRVVLETSPRLEAAMALYRSLGFLPVAAQPRSKFTRPSITLELPLRTHG